MAQGDQNLNPDSDSEEYYHLPDDLLLDDESDIEDSASSIYTNEVLMNAAYTAVPFVPQSYHQQSLAAADRNSVSSTDQLLLSYYDSLSSQNENAEATGQSSQTVPAVPYYNYQGHQLLTYRYPYMYRTPTTPIITSFELQQQRNIQPNYVLSLDQQNQILRQLQQLNTNQSQTAGHGYQTQTAPTAPLSPRSHGYLPIYGYPNIYQTQTFTPLPRAPQQLNYGGQARGFRNPRQPSPRARPYTPRSFDQSQGQP